MPGKTSADTERALALVHNGATPYRAALTAGIALSTIYRALKKIKQQKQQLTVTKLT